MAKKQKDKIIDQTTFLGPYDDQYYEIKDNLDIEDSTDSETTNILDFRVTNSKNSYPLNKSHDSNTETK